MNHSSAISPDLLAKLRQRDPAAIAQAVSDHARILYRAARGLGFSESIAEDLVQEVFTTFLEKLDDFAGRSQLQTWLFGILHRKALARRRAAQREAQLDPIEAEHDARFDDRGHWTRGPEDIERLLLSQEAGELIRACLQGLPPSQREAFFLREVEEFETHQICQMLEVSVTNLGVLLHRAKIRLRHCLEAKGVQRA